MRMSVTVRRALALLFAVMLLTPSASAQNCPPFGYPAYPFPVPSASNGTIYFPVPLVSRIGVPGLWGYKPTQTPRSYEQGQSWKWMLATIGIHDCDDYVQNGVHFFIVYFNYQAVGGYAVPAGINDDCGDGGDGGGQLAAPAPVSAIDDPIVGTARDTVNFADQELSSLSCGGGGGSDPPPPSGGGFTCIPPGCYDVYVDGAYVGHICLDRELCIRV